MAPGGSTLPRLTSQNGRHAVQGVGVRRALGLWRKWLGLGVDSARAPQAQDRALVMDGEPWGMWRVCTETCTETAKALPIRRSVPKASYGRSLEYLPHGLTTAGRPTR